MPIVEFSAHIAHNLYAKQLNDHAKELCKAENVGGWFIKSGFTQVETTLSK